MADPKDTDFLDDVDAAEAELYGTEEDETTGSGPTRPGAGAAGGPDEAAAAELESLRAERDELRDRFMRALADAENSRKRADRERRDAEAYGGARLARDLLPVYDNLHRAISASREEGETASEALIEGVELTLKELRSVFAKHGIVEIAPEVGDRFDPKMHEAMFEAPLPETRAGDIIQISAIGFMLHDRLLRPAQVGVSSNPAG